MSFGPFFLLDKSTFEGLSFECIVMLMRYYRQLIPPILLRELTSDLAKKKRGSSDQEMKKKLTRLAKKMYNSQWMLLPDSLKMACNELLYGNYIPMNGVQVPIEGATEVITSRMERGFFLDEPPMLATLRSWADGNFSDEKLCKAKAIREEDSSVDLVSLYQKIEQETDKEAKVPEFKSLKEAVDYADAICLFYKTPRQEVLRVARYFFQDPGRVGAVMRRWRHKGRPALRYFAPYATYVYRVGIVYHYCLLRGFIKRSKKGKAHLDMQYFYYLPFCQIFSSDDKEMIRLFPFFQRPDQKFIDKANLQKDLKNLSDYFASLSEEESKTFYEEYDFYPPDLKDSFTVQMWGKFMSPRQKHADKRLRRSPEEKADIIDQFREILEETAKQRTQNKKIAEGRNDPGINSTIFL